MSSTFVKLKTSDILSRVLPPRSGSRPINHSLTYFTHARLPRTALLGSIKRPRDPRASFFWQDLQSGYRDNRSQLSRRTLIASWLLYRGALQSTTTCSRRQRSIETDYLLPDTKAAVINCRCSVIRSAGNLRVPI